LSNAMLLADAASISTPGKGTPNLDGGQNSRVVSETPIQKATPILCRTSSGRRSLLHREILLGEAPDNMGHAHPHESGIGN
jgi:hypothetical protein